MNTSTATLPTPHPATWWQQLSLDTAARAWLVVALFGQLLFAAYVLLFYGGSAVAGRLERWAEVTPRGHVPGDPWGNAVFAAHLVFTVSVMVGGLIQLLPALRRRAPALHRWNGRAYLLAALVLATGGVLMMLTRGTVGSFWQQMGTALNGVVIGFLAWQAWRHARARRFDVHRRWALRLFLAVSGVWFFRVGLMAWLMLWRAPLGFDARSFSGPFLLVLSYAQFLLPLLVLELFFAAQRQAPGAPLRRVAAAVLVLATLLTALGVMGAALLMWLPRL